MQYFSNLNYDQVDRLYEQNSAKYGDAGEKKISCQNGC